MRKLVILFMVAVLGCLGAYAQTAKDGDNIALAVVIANDDIPQEACSLLESRLTRVLTANNFAANDYNDVLVLAAKIDVLQKDVVPSTPARISQKIEVTLRVGNVKDNRIYASCAIPLAGIGTNETKAFISAFSNIKPKQQELCEMLQEAKEKIVTYYVNNCPKIMAEADALAKTQQYDEAIYKLTQVPDVCNDCYTSCQSKVADIYTKKIDFKASSLLAKARTEWTKHPNASGANAVADIISGINPMSSKYKEVVALQKQINAKLQADEKREWEMKMKKIEESNRTARDIISACKAVGMAWAQNQPKSVVRNIVRGWW